MVNSMQLEWSGNLNDDDKEPEDGQPCYRCTKPILLKEHHVGMQKIDGIELFSHLYCIISDASDDNGLQIEIEHISEDGSVTTLELHDPYPKEYYRGF